MVDGIGTTTYAYSSCCGLLESEDGPFANDTLYFGYTDAKQLERGRSYKIIKERGRSYKIIKCDSGCGGDWAVIMNVAWNNYEDGAWCSLNTVNLAHEHFNGMEGV